VYRRRTDSFRFGREFRLKSDLIIRELLKTGRRSSGRFLDIRVKSYDDDLRQFCIRTPRKLGNAVFRNRLKRVIREELRKSMDRIRPGTRAVVLVKGFPADNMTSLLSDDLMRLLGNA
jgi:ribonuclease P protein component